MEIKSMFKNLVKTNKSMSVCFIKQEINSLNDDISEKYNDINELLKKKYRLITIMDGDHHANNKMGESL